MTVKEYINTTHKPVMSIIVLNMSVENITILDGIEELTHLTHLMVGSEQLI